MWPFKTCTHEWTDWEDYQNRTDFISYYTFSTERIINIGKSRWCKKCAKRDVVVWEQKREYKA